MKSSILKKIRYFIFCLPLLGNCLSTTAQEDSAAPARPKSMLYVRFYLKNNQIPYLKVQTKTKSEKGFLPAEKIPVSIFLDKDSLKDALVGDIVTDSKGESILGLPATLAKYWNQSASHTFIAHSGSTENFDATSKTISVNIARLVLDTLTKDSVKTVVARLEKKEGSSWVPMPEIDLRLSLKRFGGYLNIGDKETYATDSSGKAEGEFLQKKIPGDSTGNIQLVAILEDNDEVGTLETTMQVPWGTDLQHKTEFGKRSLWATGRRAPLWLVVMAYSCIIGVWSVIIYLFVKIFRIRKLGLTKT